MRRKKYAKVASEQKKLRRKILEIPFLSRTILTNKNLGNDIYQKENVKEDTSGKAESEKGQC